MDLNTLERHHISSGSEWEQVVGFSQAVRVGPFLHVSNIAPVNEDGNVIAPKNAYEQTRIVLQKLGDILKAAGAEYDDVTRTRIYVRQMRLWREIGQAHGEIFQHIRPAMTMLEVNNLVGPEMLVMIEADAILDVSRARI